MIIRPAGRGHLLVTAHPDGCAAHVDRQIAFVEGRPRVHGPRSVLVIGCSNGLGLATRIACAFAAGAATVGVCLERPGAETRPATPGWYNTAAFESRADSRGVPAWTVVGDAFSTETKLRTADLVRERVGRLDLVVYSLAAPRREHPDSGEIHRSVLKPIGAPFEGDTYDVATGRLRRLTLAPATEREIFETVSVMGGDDWSRWISLLRTADLLAPAARTVAFSYVGQQSLRPTYRGGTMGQAKIDLEETAHRLTCEHADLGLRARIAVMKAMVTQSSSAIPMSSLYSMVLTRVMRDKGIDEEVIGQCYRLVSDHLYGASGARLDGAGRIRLDDLELRPDVQAEVDRRLAVLTDDNLDELGDPAGFERAIRQLYGFDWPGVDYSLATDPVRPVRSLSGTGPVD